MAIFADIADKLSVEYSLLGMYAVAVSFYLWTEIKDHKATRKEATDKLATVQDARLSEMRMSIETVSKGQSVIEDLNDNVSRRLDSIDSRLDHLSRGAR